MKRTLVTKPFRSLVAVLAAAALSTPGVYAANGTWTNAPVSGGWTNVLNWNGSVVPGSINNTANNGIDTASIAFFTNAITTFGGAANPIMPDDATVVNGKARMMGRVVFDGPNCGAYVFSSPSPYAAQTATTPETGVLSLCVGSGTGNSVGSYITATVTNPQTFLVPVQIRLPSSTTGIYGFTNNATSPNATYYFQRLFLYPGGTSRGVTFVFAGSNTGSNAVALLEQSANQSSAVSGILKVGTGRWILPGANTFLNGSAMNINEGTLEVLDPAAFGAVTTTVNVNSTGVLQINGIAMNLASITLKDTGTVRMNGTASLNGINVNSGVGNNPVLATTSPSDVFTVGTGFLVTSIVTGGASDSVLNTAGPGTVQLATANTYVGNWSLNAATNQLLNYSFANSRNVNLSAGAILDVSGLGVYPLGSVSFSANGTGTGVGTTAATILAGGGSVDFGNKNITLSLAPTSFTGDTTHPALYVASGTISLNGNFFTVNNTSGTPLGVGTYRLIEQASGVVAVSGGPFAVVLGSGLAAGTIGDIVVSGGNVNLVVSAHVPASLSWQGGNPDNVWDSLSTANWNNGVGFTSFGNGDAVTFGPLGASYATVTIAATELPSSVLVDTSANDYTFAGTGLIAGPTALTKANAGILTVQTANAYLGGTTVSNGTFRVGVENAIPSAGSGNVAVYGTSVVDLNGFNNAINGLSGNGTIDNQSGGTSVLTVGNNNSSGTFTGVLKNTSGTLSLVKLGTGSQTLSAANTLAGGVTLSGGTLVAANPTALGTNIATVNSGTLNVPNDLFLGGLAGAGGSVANSSIATNTIVINGGTETTFGGSIVNGSGGLAVKLLSGSLTLSGNNTYTGGTILGSGVTLRIPNAPAAVGGSVIASNAVHLYLSGGSASPGTPAAVTTVDGAKVIFNSIAEGNIWQAQFNGGPTATNRFIGSVSAGQALSFSNFYGVVEFANTNTANSNFRFFNQNGISGGENTLFVFERVNVHTRDTQTVKLGAIAGGSSIAGIGDQAGIVSWEIGAKNTSMNFHGYISGVNNSLVKVGSGTLTLDGTSTYTNTVTLPDTSVVEYPLTGTLINYLGATTVSNGVLKIMAPNNLTNSPSITLAGGTLDATQIGYLNNQTTLDINAVEQVTNTVTVTSGIVEILAGQSLNGQGNLLGSVTTTPTSTVNVGNPIGTLAVSGSISLNGTVNMDLNRSNLAQNSDRLTAGSFSGSGAVLNVTNAGPTLIGGTVFQLFSGPVSAFTTVNLPATDTTGQIAYTWQNDLAVNGSITLLTGLNPNPTPITSSLVGNTLNLSWPLDHLGWTLQAQTNSLAVGISTNWAAVTGSAATNQVFLPVVSTNQSVFYRLTLPLP